jgi:hypothetical protein
MRRALAVLVFSSACSFSGSEGSPSNVDGGVDSGSGSDARVVDAMPIDAPPCIPGYINLCLTTPRGDELTVTSVTPVEINTGSDPRCVVKTQAGGPDICVLYFTKVDVQQNATLTVYGSRVLALASTSTITVAGTLDVSSRRTRQNKPAPGISTCPFVLAPENDGGGGGGGAGGTFATLGANGGVGDTNNNGGAPGTGLGGTVGALVTLPTLLRGGCNGQTGGTGTQAGGPGGLAGGGIYVYAKGIITISGKLLATGSGGSGGQQRGGGGGGGSGGFIVVESDTRSVLSGMFLATAGGGGEGGVIDGDGQSGGDPSSTTAAPGGSQQLEGGNGGAGATFLDDATVPPVVGSNDIGGGGGGGGGNGFILVHGLDRQITGGTFAPAPILP